MILQSLTIDSLYAALKSNNPFAFGRLTHGLWNAYFKYYNLIEKYQIEKGFARFFASVLATSDLLGSNTYNGDFSPYFLDELEELIETNIANKEIFTGITFEDYNPNDDTLFSSNQLGETQYNSIDIFNKVSKAQEDTVVYNGNFLKKAAMQGSIRGLPEYCRNRLCILVGSDDLSELGKRWELPNFIHVNIPLVFAQQYRYVILHSIQNALVSNRKSNIPIVLLRCGGLAYWLVARLQESFPKAIYLDMGQALNIWFFDTEVDIYAWSCKNAQEIITNNKLQEYYEKWIDIPFSKWLLKLGQRSYKQVQKDRAIELSKLIGKYKGIPI